MAEPEDNINMLMEKLLELEIKAVNGDAGEFDINFLGDLLSCCGEGLQYNVPLSYRNEKQLLIFLVSHLMNSNYEKVLQLSPSDIFCKEFGITCSNYDKDQAIEYFKKCILVYISDKEPNSYIKQLIILIIGISALQCFIAHNWTGPYQNKTIKFTTEILGAAEERKNLMNALSVNGDITYNNVKNPELLVLSKTLFSSLQPDICVTQKWWMFRCLMIHQQVLLEKNQVLYNLLKEFNEGILKMEWLLKETNKKEKVQFLIESALMYLYYQQVSFARKYLTEATNMIGLDFQLSGAFGKRTQFQQKALPQLFLKVERISSLWKQDKNDKITSSFPCDLHLQDDVLLNKIKFIDSNEAVVENLYAEEQVAILAYCCLIQKSSASHELLHEELMTYIDCLLSQPKVWCVHMKSLMMRCKLEKNSSRRVERAMMQMQALVDSVKKETPETSVRQFMFYSTLFPPVWIMEKELADLLLALGATKSALEIYQRLQLWEDIVICYQKLDMKNKAAEIIQQQIEIGETPVLWCLLGDVTEDPDCYFKAWNLSQQKSARAQRSLGYFYYKRKEYDESIPFFRKSVQINHLQLSVWFALAFAATQVENHELAAQAYRHVVNFDPENFEAWNNLANSYIKLKQKARAWKALQEALKCNYEQWRVWENYLLVCIDIGAFEDALHAYHRLLDIKGKHQDDEILGIIVRAVTNDMLDVNGEPVARLKKKTLELFGRITSIITNSASIWKLYAQLHISDPNYISCKESTERVIHYLQKAHRCAVQQPHWEKDLASCKSIITDASNLLEIYLTYIKCMNDATAKQQAKTSIKLMVRSILAKIEQHLNNFRYEEAEELKLHLKTLEDKLHEVLSVSQ